MDIIGYCVPKTLSEEQQKRHDYNISRGLYSRENSLLLSYDDETNKAYVSVGEDVEEVELLYSITSEAYLSGQVKKLPYFIYNGAVYDREDFKPLMSTYSIDED